RVDLDHTVRGLLTCPQVTVAGRELGRRDRIRPRRTGFRVDPRDRAVAGVRNPDAAVQICDAGRAVAHVERVDDVVVLGIDLGHGPVQAVGDPDGPVPDGDAARLAPDVDRVNELLRRRIDARHGVAVRVGDPGRALAHGDVARRGTRTDLAGDLA